MGSKRGHHRQQDTRQVKRSACAHTSPDDPDAGDWTYGSRNGPPRWIKRSSTLTKGLYLLIRAGQPT